MVCIHINVIVIFLLNFCCVDGAASGNSEVILVHVLFNSGEQSAYKINPTHPQSNRTLLGPGKLTNNGKMMEFKLGSILRENYRDLLGDDYTDDKLEMRSTDTVSAHMSALLVLAGLWPPSENQQWHPSLMWQPIPIVSKPLRKEDLLDSTFCEFKNVVLDNLSKEDAVYKDYIEPHKSVFEYVEKNSGIAIKDLANLIDFYFTLKGEDAIGSELPKWTQDVYPEPLQSIVSHVYEYVNFNPEIKKINSGYLLQKMLNDSVAKINNELEPAGRKMFLYSTQEMTVGCLLHSLKVLKPHVPSYGSAVILELHKKGQGYVFKLRYLTDPVDSKIQDVTIPSCDIFCPVNKFIELQNDILPIISFEEACDIRNTTHSVFV